MEREPTFNKPPEPTVTEDDAEKDLELRARYFEEHIALIVAGEPTWMRRSFKTDNRRYLDYWVDGIHQGFIDQQYGGFSEIYVKKGPKKIGPQRLGGNETDLIAAKEKLEYLINRVLGHRSE
jgi:hypothetical protein